MAEARRRVSRAQWLPGGAEVTGCFLAGHIEADLEQFAVELEDAAIGVAGFRAGDEFDVDVVGRFARRRC